MLKKAGAEVVKQVKNPLLSGMIYPLLQALDEVYLDCDAQFGGVDQRKIFTFADEYLPKLNYKKSFHLMNFMVPSFNASNASSDGKMNSSDVNSKIDCLSSFSEIKKKISKAFCEEGNVENNGILEFVRLVFFPLHNKFVIQKPEKFGGEKIIYNSFEELSKDFQEKTLHPADLKMAVIDKLETLISPLREYFESPNMKELINNAYPEEKM